MRQISGYTDMKTARNVRNIRTHALSGVETTPDQWVALAAVVDRGGYAAAAEALDRSQSAVSYQVTRLQETLGIELLGIKGRRTALTAHGEALLTRARGLLQQWRALEAFARTLGQGFEPGVKLVVEAAFPKAKLLSALLELRQQCPSTQFDLSEAVLSGAEEAIIDAADGGGADVVITAHVPQGFLGDWLCDISFVACASPQHPLFEIGHELSLDDLTQHQQVVLRDSGSRAPRDEGYLGARLRWTVGAMETSLAIIESGLAYAWLPEHLVEASVTAGRLKILPLAAGGWRKVPLYVVLVRPTEAGPAAHTAVQLLHRAAAERY
jgi:DNA-binding transcriptional LysR family regulator